MKSNSLSTGIFLDLILSTDIQGETNDIIKRELPVYMSKLSCFIAGILKRNLTELTDLYFLSAEPNNDESWQFVKKYISDYAMDIQEGYLELSYNKQYFYIYILANYGFLVFGREKALSGRIKNEFTSVVNFLAKAICHSIEEERRKEVENILMEERHLLRTIIDNIPINIYAKDIEYKKTLANTSELQYLGRSSESEVIGKTDFELYDETMAFKILQEDKAVILEGKTIINQESIMKDDRYSLISKLPLKNEQGNLVGMVGISFDYTERKKIENQLSVFSELLNNLSDGIEVASETGQLVYVNKISSERLGILPEKVHEYSVRDFEVLLETDEAWRNHVNNIKSRDFLTFEGLNKNQVTGEIYPVEVTLKYIRVNDKGYIVGNNRNISERKRAELELLENEKKYRILFESNPQPMWIFDAETFRFMEVNNAAVSHYGYSREEFLSMTNEKLYNKEDITLLNEALKEAESEMKETLQSRHVIKKGDLIDVEITSHAVVYNGRKAFHVLIKDITYRKNIERELFQTRKNYGNIISNMKLGFVELDLNQNVLSINQSFSEMSGYTSDELLGQSPVSFHIEPEYVELIKSKLILRKQGISDSYEVNVLNKQGEYKWWLISGAPNYNDNSELMGSVIVLLDITDRKILEKEVTEALKQAEQASKLKEEFLANMSHEIRTPLNVITGMIRELGKEDLNDKQRSYVNHSEIAAEHLLTIINNILDMSKIESGEFELDNTDFSVSALVDNIRSILFLKAREKNLELRIDFSDDIKKALVGDAGRLRQILINLLGNSIKFTDSGSIDLKVNVLSTNDCFQQLRFDVSDTGIGMSDEFINKIFDKFSQEEGSAKRRFEGTGLGMSITKELIQLMGGEIEVSSVKGEGTQISFKVQLPIGDPAKLVNKSKIDDKDTFIGMKILLVEDNEMNRFIAIQSLKHLGYEITEAKNGLEAIEKIQQSDFDLILMDIQMPFMDGVEATKQIRSKYNADVPIIALTANAFKHDIDLYLSVGMNNYLIKPYKENELLEKIGIYSNKHKNQESCSVNLSSKVSLFDLSQIRELSRGDEQFVKRMLVAFKNLANQTTIQLAEALDNNDLSTIGMVAHKIKPSIDNLSIISIHDKVRLLEKFNPENNTDSELKILVDDVNKVLRKVVEDIELVYFL